jgi:hypothetical protein
MLSMYVYILFKHVGIFRLKYGMTVNNVIYIGKLHTADMVYLDR